MKKKTLISLERVIWSNWRLILKGTVDNIYDMQISSVKNNSLIYPQIRLSLYVAFSIFVLITFKMIMITAAGYFMRNVSCIVEQFSKLSRNLKQSVVLWNTLNDCTFNQIVFQIMATKHHNASIKQFALCKKWIELPNFTEST